MSRRWSYRQSVRRFVGSLVTFSTRRPKNYTSVIRCAKDGRLGVRPWPVRGEGPAEHPNTTEEKPVFLPQLKRIRWAVRATLMLGVAASVAANVLHARPEIVSQVISAWPPLALLLTVELTSRIPMHKPLLAGIRVLATATIAGIAAWVSYWHMQGVAVKFGESESSAYLLPISVDGLIVVASVSLVELAGRIRLLAARRMSALAAPVAHPPPAPAPFVRAAPVSPAVAPLPVRPTPPAVEPEPVREPVAAAVTHATPVRLEGLATPNPRVPTSPLSGRPLGNPNGNLGSVSAEAPSEAPVSPALAGIGRSYPDGATSVRPGMTRAAVSTAPRPTVTESVAPATDGTPRQRRPLLETADLADAIEAMRPGISPSELAEELGISPTRLRAVRREAREVRRSTVRR